MVVSLSIIQHVSHLKLNESSAMQILNCQ